MHIRIQQLVCYRMYFGLDHLGLIWIVKIIKQKTHHPDGKRTLPTENAPARRKTHLPDGKRTAPTENAPLRRKTHRPDGKRTIKTATY